MKRISLALVAFFAAAVPAWAVIAPVAPFAPTAGWVDGFDVLAPGSYASFPQAGGRWTVSRLSTAGSLLVTFAPALPPQAGARAMFGRNTDVRFRFAQPVRTFGAFFRTPAAGVPATNAIFIFRNNALGIVGWAVAPINPAAWQWRGYSSTVPFVYLDVLSVAPAMGYAGMDSVRVRL